MGSELDHLQLATSQLNLESRDVGQVMHFTSGQFAGKAMRAELQEIQKAELGRKYAKVDRRPLDPPPAILLRLFNIYNAGTSEQWEKEIDNYQEVQTVGFICTLDLFPVPESFFDDQPPGQHLPQGSTPLDEFSTRSQIPSFTFFPLHPFTNNDDPSLDVALSPPFQLPRRQLILTNIIPSNGLPPDVAFRSGNHLITESSKLTPALVGEKFMEPTLIDYHGKKALVFVFGDLAVQREGTFVFRYRTFDLFSSIAGGTGIQVQAELYGGAFRVYSTREFPGLQASTELTKHLSKYGARVTMRDTERKARKGWNRNLSSPSMSADSQ